MGLPGGRFEGVVDVFGGAVRGERAANMSGWAGGAAGCVGWTA